MKIFVANLGYNTKAEDIRRLFMRYGYVSHAKVIMDKETNRSKCYGFVEMPKKLEAYVAIVELNETMFQGSIINVKKSRPQ